MDASERITDEILFDYVMGQCDAAVTRQVSEALEQDADLAARHRRLRSSLAPLEAWAAPEPRAGLVDDILDAVARDSTLKFEPAASALPADRDADIGRGPILTLRELVALAACITIFVGIFVPALSRARFNSRRQMCASHLGSLYRGLAEYTTINAGMLPFTGSPQPQPWLPQAGQRPMSNRRQFVPAVVQGYVKPTVLICPARKGDEALELAAITPDGRWVRGRHISFDVQHLGTPRPQRLSILVRTRMPFVSDANPLFDGGRFNANVDPEMANSTSHDGLGQNVLHYDGAVAWYDTPNCEPVGDNIWQAGRIRQYRGDEAPTAATDVFMVP